MTDKYILQLDTVLPSSDQYLETDDGTTSGKIWVNSIPVSMYKIQPSVTSNNLTLALLNADGEQATEEKPIRVRIAGVIRTITTALFVTVNAAANTFNSGSASLATKEVDYFVYLSWVEASSTVAIGFARFPNGGVGGDFSSTATNEKYAAWAKENNQSVTVASTDAVEVIGRFAATLSAGAGYTWSVPTYTNINLIQRPIYETRWLSFAVASFTCSGSMTYGTVTIDDALYRFVGNDLVIELATSAGTVGGTPSTTISAVPPFTPAFAATIMPMYGWANTNGAYQTALAYATSASINVRLYNSGNWTAGNSLFGVQGRFKY